MTTVVGFWSDHDPCFTVAVDGTLEIHVELERWQRVKERPADAAQVARTYLETTGRSVEDVDWWLTAPPSRVAQRWPSWAWLQHRPLRFLGHHHAHAAHAYLSSATTEGPVLVVVVDGGGYETEGTPLEAATACSVWSGEQGVVSPLDVMPLMASNVGSVWNRVTTEVFGLSAGPPLGDQAGSIMAMAAFASPDALLPLYERALRDDLSNALGFGNQGLAYWAEHAAAVRADFAFGLRAASALQTATEEYVRALVREWSGTRPWSGLCLSGGVALNSVLVGKLSAEYPQLGGVFVPPAPHDGGLSLGLVQASLRTKGHVAPGPLTPFLGRATEEAEVHQAARQQEIQVSSSDLDWVVAALARGAVGGFFGGPSEVGRRTLGNRSIIASPSSAWTRDRVNHLIKGRAWYRPLAPSLPVEGHEEWLASTPSPYMSSAVPATEALLRLAPAAVHIDGTTRAQGVREAWTPSFSALLQAWGDVSGCPVLVNTSLNRSAPICDTPRDALKTMKAARLDFMYFHDYGLVVTADT
jgi:carbamoyltransferase